MILLPLLDVVFVGLVGTDPGHVQTQLTQILGDQSVVAKKVSTADATALTRQASNGPAIIKKLAVDGVVASEIVVDKGHRSLVIVVYDGAGNLLSMAETPFAGKTLASADLRMIHDNLDDEIGRLVAKSKKTATATAKKPDAKKPAAVVATAPMKPAEPEAPEAEDDPLAPAHKQVATATPGEPAAVVETTAAPSQAHGHDLRAALGFGAMTRTFSPGPASVAGFDSSAVPSIRIDVRGEPMPKLTVGASFERTLSMHTDTPTEIDSTSITRWDAGAGYRVLHGRVDVTPEVGVGRRVFEVVTTDPKATPNSDYVYIRLGATASTDLTPAVTLFGSFAYEPVIGGASTIDMALGNASRWAFDVGAGVEIRPATHIYVRALADYQQFSWSWDMASGGGTDSYPSATVQVGARY